MDVIKKDPLRLSAVRRVISPAPEECMVSRTEPEDDCYTLCQIIREIYSDTDDHVIKFKCRIGLKLAKDMSRKLIHLDPNYQEGFWPERRQFTGLL